MRVSWVACTAAVLAMAAASAGPDVSGRWVAEVDTPAGPVSYTFTFSVAGTTLTGSGQSSRSPLGVKPPPSTSTKIGL